MLVLFYVQHKNLVTKQTKKPPYVRRFPSSRLSQFKINMYD
ncbi:hypothetical protein EMIT079MI2_30068 [Bacillus sp. IT-79MI2]